MLHKVNKINAILLLLGVSRVPLAFATEGENPDRLSPPGLEPNVANPANEVAVNQELPIILGLEMAMRQSMLRMPDGLPRFRIEPGVRWPDGIPHVRFEPGVGRAAPAPDDPLIQAILNGNMDTVAFLLDAGLDPNAIVDREKGNTVIMWVVLQRARFEAIRPGLTLEIAQLLINAQNFDPNLHNADEDTILHICVKCCALEILARLLGLPNLNVNVRNRYGQTVLHLLIQKIGYPSLSLLPMIRRIIEHPTFQLNATDINGRSVMQMLEDVQANVNKICNMLKAMGEGALEPIPEETLCDAIMDQNVEEMKKIIAEQTLNANWKNARGQNLLMFAVATGNPAIVEVILDNFHEIDLAATDSNVQTAMDYARKNRNEIVIGMLMTAGGR
jgi:hypothetical protein